MFDFFLSYMGGLEIFWECQFRVAVGIQNFDIFQTLQTLLPYKLSIILKLKGHIKRQLITSIIVFVYLKKISIRGFKIVRSFVKVDQNICKNANKSTSMYTNQIRSYNQIKLSPWTLRFREHVLKMNETTTR